MSRRAAKKLGLDLDAGIGGSQAGSSTSILDVHVLLIASATQIKSAAASPPSLRSASTARIASAGGCSSSSAGGRNHFSRRVHHGRRTASFPSSGIARFNRVAVGVAWQRSARRSRAQRVPKHRTRNARSNAARRWTRHLTRRTRFTTPTGAASHQPTQAARPRQLELRRLLPMTEVHYDARRTGATG